MKVKLAMFVACCLLVVGQVTAQTRRVTGVVTSAENGEPVVGASVGVKEAPKLGAFTDADGKFEISNLPNEAKTLVISSVGFETKQVAVAANVKVALTPTAVDIDEVLVVAYGTAKKSSFTGSAASIDNSKLESRPISSLTKALEGQVAGVQTTSGGGQPGANASIVIRGFGSINASNTPLYVVDGVPYDGAINAINPNDIESMTILKDASAGALYGARGANGVVMITTKKGGTRTDINFKANYGFSSRALPRYKTLGTDQFVQITYEALRNGYVFNDGYGWIEAREMAMDALGSTLGGEIYNPYKDYSWNEVFDRKTARLHWGAEKKFETEDWMDALEHKGAPRQEYQFSISGGNDKLRSMLSMGYINEQGVLQYTSFERMSGRVNLDYQAKHWLGAGLNAAFSTTNTNFSDYDGSSMSNVWYTAQFMAPIYPVYQHDINGALVLDGNGQKQLDYGASRPQMSNFNCIGTLIDDKFNTRRDNFSGRAHITLGSDDAKAGALKGLKLTANLGVDYINNNTMYYYNMYHGNFSSYGGLMEKTDGRTFSYTANQLLTYNRSFGDHNLDVLVGHEYYAYRYNYMFAEKSGLVDGIYELAPATTVMGASSYEDNYRIESLLTRLNYNYAEKYYLSLSYRRDASSRFHRDNRAGNFWSVGANWRISQEGFLQGTDWLNNLALRASYGVQGNDNLGTYYAWQSFYDLTWPNGNNAGAVVSSLENRDLSWEKNANFNVGLDARLFDRLNIGLEYFNRQTYDLLLSYPMAMSTGFTGYNANVGAISNSGIEFTVGATLINRRNFRWNATVMGSTLRNRVKKLTEESPEIISGIRSLREGYEYWTYYLAKSAGVDPATGAQLYYAYESGAYFNTGSDTPMIKDVDADGNEIEREAKVWITDDYSVAAKSRWYQGSRIPKLQGAVNMDFQIFRDFDLSVVTSYSLGGKIYDSLYRGLMEQQYAGSNWSQDILRRWQKPGDITDVPRVEINGSYTTTDRWLINASYFAIKNITLGYSLPAKLMKSARMNSVRFYVSMDNVYLFSHLKGMDPQYNFTGGTDYTYSPNRTTSFGVDINF